MSANLAHFYQQFKYRAKYSGKKEEDAASGILLMHCTYSLVYQS